MNEMLFTTGQLSGITSVSQMSLYRYVKEFQEFFSETARQHKKGRRWTVHDLELVQAIRYLHHEHKPKEEIKLELSRGWRPAIRTAYDIETMSRLLNQTYKYIEEAKRLVADASRELHRAKIENQSNAQLWDKVHYWTDRIDKINREIERLKFFLHEPHSPKKRDRFYSVWQEFKKDLRRFYGD